MHDQGRHNLAAIFDYRAGQGHYGHISIVLHKIIAYSGALSLVEYAVTYFADIHIRACVPLIRILLIHEHAFAQIFIQKLNDHHRIVSSGYYQQLCLGAEPLVIIHVLIGNNEGYIAGFPIQLLLFFRNILIVKYSTNRNAKEQQQPQRYGQICGQHPGKQRFEHSVSLICVDRFIFPFRIYSPRPKRS